AHWSQPPRPRPAGGRSGATRGPTFGCVLAFLGAVALRVLELRAFLDRRLFQLRPDYFAHGLDPVGDDVPLLAVPLLDGRHAADAFMVVAGDLDRGQEPLHAELLEPLIGHVQVLVAPANLLTGRGLVPELGHRRADGLDVEHRVGDAAV